jgi:hypothetical protein
MLCLTDLIAAETGRIQGFIAGKFNISYEAIEKNQQPNWNDVFKEAAIKLLECAGKDWQLVKR